MENYWIAVDETGLVTVHQQEPYYNRLHMKWKSSNLVYVSKGLINLITDYVKEPLVKAYAIELDGHLITGNKARILRITKIF